MKKQGGCCRTETEVGWKCMLLRACACALFSSNAYIDEMLCDFKEVVQSSSVQLGLG